MKPMRDVASILPLAVEAVSFLADGRRLIDAMSFAMPAGGLTVLLGPNGAGKSLTLRLCHGLLTLVINAATYGASRAGARFAG